MTTRGSFALKERTVYEQKVTPRGQHYYQSYHIGKLLGKGGFAICHQIRYQNDDKKYAVKIIQKQTQHHNKLETVEKVKEEIDFIASLDHPGVVKYYHHFQDNDYIYIILQICAGGCLSDILKKRKHLTESEVRYFIAQIVDIMSYIKQQNIIHRDIKLANYFLDSNYRLKLGDFGLATKNDDVFRMRRKVCGTPNYIAPEVIEKKSYDFEVDSWSNGIVIFTLLFGEPPFETKSCKQTYERIKRCSYKFQGHNKNVHCSEEAKDFLKQILCLDPIKRMKIEQYMSHPFMSRYAIPKELEVSFPISAPSHSFIKLYGKAIRKKEAISSRKNLELSKQGSKQTSKQASLLQKKPRVTYKNVLKQQTVQSKTKIVIHQKSYTSTPEKKEKIQEKKGYENAPVKQQKNKIQQNTKQNISFEIKEEQSEQNVKGRKKFVSNARKHIAEKVLKTEKKETRKIKMQAPQIPQELPQPPTLEGNWTRPSLKIKLKNIDRTNKNLLLQQKQLKIVEWQDLIDKYGVLYVLSNNQIGFLFNDMSRIIFSPQDEQVHYLYKKQHSQFHEVYQAEEIELLASNNEKLYWKIQIFMPYFQNARKRFPINPKPSAQTAILPVHLIKCTVSPTLTIMKLSNNNLQFFFPDSTSIFLSMTQQLITYRSESKITIKNIPCNPYTILEPDFRQKIKSVLLYYSKFLSPHSGSNVLEKGCWWSKGEVKTEPQLKQEVINK